MQRSFEIATGSLELEQANCLLLKSVILGSTGAIAAAKQAKTAIGGQGGRGGPPHCHPTLFNNDKNPFDIGDCLNVALVDGTAEKKR